MTKDKEMKKGKLKIGSKYEIEWLDTFSFNGWWNDEELEKKTQKMNYLQRGVGILAKEDKDWIVLATHENPSKDFARWGHPDWIPRGCIRDIKKLKYEKGNKGRRIN